MTLLFWDVLASAFCLTEYNNSDLSFSFFLLRFSTLCFDLRLGFAGWGCTYTWTFFSCTEAVVASVGKRRVDSAASPATTRATVVKKPKTACARLREECIARGDSEVLSPSCRGGGRAMKPAGRVWLIDKRSMEPRRPRAPNCSWGWI